MACFTPENNAYCLPIVNAFLDTGEKREIKTFKTKKISDEREICMRGNMIKMLFYANLKLGTHHEGLE